MVTGIEITTLDFIMTQLVANVTGSFGLLSLFIIILALGFCMANGLNTVPTVLVMTPLITGLVLSGFAPTIFWIIPIMFISILWIVVFYKMFNLGK